LSQCVPKRRGRSAWRRIPPTTAMYPKLSTAPLGRNITITHTPGRRCALPWASIHCPLGAKIHGQAGGYAEFCDTQCVTSWGISYTWSTPQRGMGRKPRAKRSAALGNHWYYDYAPTGQWVVARNAASIPHILFIVLDIVFFQKLPVFFLKCHSLMMMFLIGDVRPHCFFV